MKALRIIVLISVAASLTGCGVLDRFKKTEDAGSDAAVDAAPVAVVEDAGVDAAPVVVQDEIPSPDGDDQRANRDIGFGNFREELDKLEKDFAASQKKK